jgi:hypothetical protein
MLDGICSASFVSAGGLVMSNHHCSLEFLVRIMKSGEDLNVNGFYAPSLKDERKVDNLYVKQLISVRDVSDIILAAMDLGSSTDEKFKNRDDKIKELEDESGAGTGLECKVYSFFNGAKYFLYCYKLYNDVRFVFAPEHQIGYFGGDEDNFTYPRYDLDVAFFRVYDNGKPLKTENYFRWSTRGASIGEDVFMIGNPGRTNRLRTVAQLEYNRDVLYPALIFFNQLLVEYLKKFVASNPEKKFLVAPSLFGVENFLKAVIGYRNSLSDTSLFNKKIILERKMRALVESDPALNNKYGGIWSAILEARSIFRKHLNELIILDLVDFRFSSNYFLVAKKILTLAVGNELSGPSEAKSIDSLIKFVIPEDFDADLAKLLLEFQIDVQRKFLGDDYVLDRKIFTGGSVHDAAENMISGSSLTDKAKLKNLLSTGSEGIVNSNDPILYYVQNAERILDSINAVVSPFRTSEDYNKLLLGELFCSIYGNAGSPDANGTLRISDAVIKPYSYNGTLAPAFTTFYGMYDRYYSFNGSFPWNLPDRWVHRPFKFKLETPLCFCATADGIGGNSGSAVINEKGELVGIFFDINVEALANNFIFSDVSGRSIFVDCRAIIQSLKHIYKASRLVDELQISRE